MIEEQQAVGRGDQPEHDVDDDDHAEVDEVNAAHLGGRDQDRER